jgi:two-component system, chemotaxis family, protein-glutamate methylesterase/glutaminase
VHESYEGSIIAIGASAGGVDALRRLVSTLPHGFPAPIFIVLHVGEVSYMPEVLARAGPLPVVRPESGDRIVPGSIYVAPPGKHMLVHDDHILLRRGPRENLARPAIDPLFRSLACSFGARTIGAVLTGSLSDGASGLHAIKRCGGIGIVQDPDDAMVPAMPRNALENVEVDHCVPLSELGALLTRLVAEPAREMISIPGEICLEAAIAAQEHVSMESDDKLGKLSPFTCPECQGPLWEIEEGKLLRYRCHAGHALTAEAMISAQATEAENTLERLLRVQQQRAAMAHRIAARDAAEGRHDSAERMERRAREYEGDAEMIGRLLVDRAI